MDAQLAITLRVGDQVIFRNAIHTIVAVAESDGAPNVLLDGAYAPVEPVPYTMLYLPVLLNSDVAEGRAWRTPS